MNKLNEAYEVLEELLRQVNSLISPITHHQDLERLTPDFMTQDSSKNPSCYLKLAIGAKHTLFPLCSMNGIHSPEMINFSLKLADKLNQRDDVDRDKLNVIIKKLNIMKQKLSQPVPKPGFAGYLKGLATGKLKKELDHGRQTGLQF